MNLLNPISHQALRLACLRSDRAFQANRFDLQAIQRKRLESIVSRIPALAREGSCRAYSQLHDRYPVSRYADWKGRVQTLRESLGQEGKGADTLPLIRDRLVRFQPTSGSSEQLKLIPYTKGFLAELDAAIGPWLSSLYRTHPGLSAGTHYWSVSWLPESQRKATELPNLNDDSALLNVGKRVLSQLTQAVPSEVAFAGSAQDALFATLCYLVATPRLSMMSVWSPTFALQLLEQLQDWKWEIVRVLETGHWATRQATLSALKAPRSRARATVLARSAVETPEGLQHLWPDLALVSAWDTAGARDWAHQLRQRLPQAGFEGKGLWATEGVVTIPYQGQYPLAYHSHFYEFERLSDASSDIIPSWLLKEGDEVSPILSGGNGLLRYSLDDRLVVTGFYGKVPCFEFQGRRFGVDLVGEKLDPVTARSVLADLQTSHPDIRPVSLLAVDTIGTGAPYYLGLIEVPEHLSAEDRQRLTALLPARLDRCLKRHFHYELARDLQQLGMPKIVCVNDGWGYYKHLAVKDGMIEGNIKPEPLRRIHHTALTQQPARKGVSQHDCAA